MTTENQKHKDDLNIQIDDYQYDWNDLSKSLSIGNGVIDTTSGYNGAISGAYSSGNYTIAGSGQNTVWATSASPYVMNTSGRIDITGEQADINMNGKSLRTWMEAVEQRLAILQPNPLLEAEWTELKELGDRYRTLEKDIKEKMKTWDILKQPE